MALYKRFTYLFTSKNQQCSLFSCDQLTLLFIKVLKLYQIIIFLFSFFCMKTTVHRIFHILMVNDKVQIVGLIHVPGIMKIIVS